MPKEQEAAFTEREDTQHGRFLTFILGDEVFGIPIRYVKEIIGLMPITKLPETPEHIRGIINLRGKVIPVIDVRLKFRKEAMAYTDRTCIIVIETPEIMAGLIVDSVEEVVTIDDENIVPPPHCGSQALNRCVSGIGKTGGEVKILLDCEALFIEDEKRVLAGI